MNILILSFTELGIQARQWNVFMVAVKVESYVKNVPHDYNPISLTEVAQELVSRSTTGRRRRS